MTTSVETLEQRIDSIGEKKQFAGSVAFDWGMLAVCAWLIGGAHLDAWAHNHIPQLETFFTPWHAVLYSGLLAVLCFLMGSIIINHRKGYSWNQAIPPGYELSYLGAIGFIFAGLGDMIWHILFGIERNIDAVFSPTHLLLALCLGLIVSGPFRAAWRRKNTGQKHSFIELLPMLLSLALTLSTITLISQFAHPFVNTWPSYGQQLLFGEQALAVISMIFQTIILMGLVLLTMRRWTLPFGSLTLVFTLNIALLSIMQDTYVLIPVAFLTGMIADILIWRMKPSAKRPDALRIFAFAVPTTLYLLYFLTLDITTGVEWTIHLWLGATVVTGIAGWLLSYLVVPPQIPAVVEQAET